MKRLTKSAFLSSGIIAVMAILLCCISSPIARAGDPLSDVCIEDGGHAECSYQLQKNVQEGAVSAGGGISLGWYATDLDTQNAILTNVPGCASAALSPGAPWSWTVSAVYPGLAIGWATPTVTESYSYWSAGVCTPTTLDWTISQSAQLYCNLPWQTATTASTSNPYGFCYRPTLQRCQKGQCSAVAGDPIDGGDGNETEREVDYNGGSLPHLAFVRAYNYLGSISGPGTPQGTIGTAWSHSFERRLWFYPGGAIRALRPDGNHDIFLPSGSGYAEYGTGVDQLIPVGGSSSPTGWTFIDENDTNESYDASGNLLSITYRAGDTLTMTYSTGSTPTSIAPAPGLLITVTDAFGHQLNLTYNSNGQIATLSDPSGQVYSYSYSSSASGPLLSSVTYPDSTTRQYLYNESTYTDGTNLPFALTGIIDESGTRYATIGWNWIGQAVSSQLAGGVDSYTFTSIGYSAYYGAGFTYLTDPLGTSRVMRFAAANNVGKFSSINQLCSTCGDISAGVTYDSNGNVASRTDFNSNQTTYSYDLTRNLETARTEGYGSPRARTITTSWDSSWRQPDLITESNRTTGFAYDSLGNALTKTVTDTTVSPNVSRTWTYTYDSYGRMLTAKGPRTDLTSTTTYTYYTCTTGTQCGLVHTVTDPVGNVTTYNSYDANGSLVTMTDPNGVVTTLTYDARERLSSRQVGAETTTFTYYQTGLLKKVTLPDASYLQYTYDGAHRLTQVADGAGNSIQYGLDAMGNRLSESTYDPSSVLSRTQSRVFNSLNQLYQQIGAAGTTAVTTNYGYDSNGNRNSIQAPLSRNTTNAYDELNRLKQITDPTYGNTYFGYDTSDDLTSVQDPLGFTTSYSYNGFGDLMTLVSPDTGTTTKTYDSGGNLATNHDARSKTATYSYDALHRVTQVAYGDQTIAYSYDAGTNGKGRLTGASDSAHSMSWQYDGLGRVTNKSQTVASVTLAVSYAYTNGDLTTLTTPSGQSIGYVYGDHQINSISVNGSSLLSGVAYEPFGPSRGWSWGNSASEVRLHDTDGNPSDITGAEATTYTVDSAFRITGISNASSSALSWTYGYDGLDRLTSAAQTAGSYGWTYDANGNRLAQTGTSASTFAISSSNNQINGISGALSRSYSYDAAGNALNDGINTFTYNNRGRLSSASTTGLFHYIYNALGQRMEMYSSTTATLFIYDEVGHLLGEYDGSGTMIEETVWMGDIPVATLRPNGSGINVYYIHADHLNAPKTITRPSDNAIVWRWDQDPFGTAAPNQNPSSLGTFAYNLRFPGQYYDAESGLNYNYYRDYDPQVGRYVESDPIGLRGGSYSTYTYANNSPVMVFDPTGLLVEVIGHVAADPLGRITSPTSYHSALYLKPDDPCHCSGSWPVTLGAQDIGGTLVGTPNYSGDAISRALFKQVVRPPAGMSDCDFIRSLISAAASYGSNLPYSFPSIPSGAMSPGQYNSNSFVSGVLQAVGATPPSINTGGQFQLPGYQNPIPSPAQH